MTDFLHLIVESNLFNFSIFLLIIIVVAKKIDIPSMLEKLKNNISEKINASENKKNNALNKLSEAKESVKASDKEIEIVLNDTKNNAENIKNKIISDANEKIDEINNNSKKIILNEENTLNNLLTSQQAKKSLDIARNHIIQTLKENPDLQRKFLDYSLKELDEVVL